MDNNTISNEVKLSEISRIKLVGFDEIFIPDEEESTEEND